MFHSFQKNVQERLKEYGLADIFGKRVGNTFYAGLVDSASLGEFDEHFECLKPGGSYENPPACQPVSHAFIIIFPNTKPML